MNKTMAIVRDALGIVGVVMIAVGTGMIYLPAGVITGGLLLVAGAFLSARGG